MAIEFRLPELGEAIDKAEVATVLVSAGDRVQKEQTLLAIETDKAAMDLPSPGDGIVESVHVKVGDVVSVGALLVTLQTEGSEYVEDSPKSLETEAAETVEPPTQQSPPEPALSRAPTTSGRETGPKVPPFLLPEEKPSSTTRTEEVLAGPATRRLARELGVDLTLVKGTGPHGRIAEEDVKAFVHQRITQIAAGASSTGESPADLPDFSRWGTIERQPFRSIRKKTAIRVSLAWSQVPHVTQHEEADVTNLESLRKQLQSQAESGGGKLTLMAFLLKACARALREFPQFNSSLDLFRDELVLKSYCHIGIAVDTERGLLVPVIRDVDTKGVIELAVEMTNLADRARRNQIKAEELQGGSFTITNLGGIGGTAFTPIVNYPEVAILGVSRSRVTPVFREDSTDKGGFEPRLLLPLSLSYDHRVIDGAAAARFTRHIAELLEKPGDLLDLR